MMRIVRRIIHRVSRKTEELPLGRWRVDNTHKIVETKMKLATDDNCIGGSIIRENKTREFNLKE
jgi:hypothetical protein